MDKTSGIIVLSFGPELETSVHQQMCYALVPSDSADTKNIVIFIYICIPCQQLQGQSRKQHTVDILTILQKRNNDSRHRASYETTR